MGPCPKMLYALVGTVSSALYLGCLWGVLLQIATILGRRKRYSTRGESLGFATRALSVNGFASSFLAFYVVYVYSLLMSEVDYFILATRLAASIVTLYVLFEIYRDRTSLWDRLPFQIGAACLLMSVLVPFLRDRSIHDGTRFSILIVVLVTAIMLQGGLSQIALIVRQKCTGALSARMNLIFFFKDVMNVAFGAIIDFNDGWPLMFIGGVSAALKLTILSLFLFYPGERPKTYADQRQTSSDEMLRKLRACKWSGFRPRPEGTK